MRLNLVCLIFALCDSKPYPAGKEPKQIKASKEIEVPSLAQAPTPTIAAAAAIGKVNKAAADPKEKGSKGKDIAASDEPVTAAAKGKGDDGGDILGGAGGGGGGDILPGQIFGFPLMTVVLVAGGGFIVWKYVLKK